MPWGKDGITIQPHPELLQRTTEISCLIPLHEEMTRGHYTKNYIDDIKGGVRAIVAETKIHDITKIDYELLCKFKNLLLARGVENLSINGYLSQINCFLQFFGIRLEIPHIPNRKGREAKILRSLWKPEQVKRLLEVIPLPKYLAAVALLYFVGLRVGASSHRKGYPREGLLGLNWGDIDFENGTIKIIGKRGKEYIRPLPELAEKYLRQLKESMSKTEPNNPVFQSIPGRRLAYFSLYSMLRKYMNLVKGVRKEQKHPHAFRHTRGTIAAKKYGIRRAKGILMHDNLNSTLIYEHINDEEDLMELIRPDKVQETEKDIEMKQCPSCKAEVLPNRKLCDCGYDFTLHRCPKCGRDVDKDAVFCCHCGQRINPPKPSCICGYPLKSDYKVCPNCGRQLKSIKSLWSKDNLEKWNRLVGNTNEDLGEADLSTKQNNIPNSVKDKPKAEALGAIKSDLNVGNHKPFDSRIVVGEEGLLGATAEGWDFIGKLPEDKYLVRRKHERSECSEFKND